MTTKLILPNRYWYLYKWRKYPTKIGTFENYIFIQPLAFCETLCILEDTFDIFVKIVS